MNTEIAAAVRSPAVLDALRAQFPDDLDAAAAALIEALTNPRDAKLSFICDVAPALSIEDAFQLTQLDDAALPAAIAAAHNVCPMQ